MTDRDKQLRLRFEGGEKLSAEELLELAEATNQALRDAQFSVNKWNPVRDIAWPTVLYLLLEGANFIFSRM